MKMKARVDGRGSSQATTALLELFAAAAWARIVPAYI